MTSGRCAATRAIDVDDARQQRAGISSSSPPNLTTIGRSVTAARSSRRSAEHDVHVLHRLARRALQQVVDDRDENRAARRIDAPADVAEVRVRDVLDFGQRRSDETHERRVAYAAA